MISFGRVAVAGLVIASAIGGVAAGCGGDDESGTTARAGTDVSGGELLPAATFERLPQGWRPVVEEDTLLTTRGAVSESVATSWDFDPATGTGPAGSLPDGGAIVNVMLLRRSSGGEPYEGACAGVTASSHYPSIERLPLKLADMSVGELEGAPQVSEHRLRGAFDGDYYIEVRVDIRARAERQSLLREAQEVLDGLKLPRWGDRC